MKRLALVVAVGLALAACTTATKPVDTVPPTSAAPATGGATSTVAAPVPTATVGQTPQAAGDAKVETVRTFFKSWADSGGSAFYEIVIEVKNTGEKPANIHSGDQSYTIFATDGSVLKTSNFGYSFPQVLAPGELGYYIGGEHYDVGTKPALVGKLEPSLSYSNADNAPTPWEFSNLKVGKDDIFGGAEVSGVVKNTGAEDAKMATVGIVLFDANGDMLGGVVNQVPGTALRAGQSKGFIATYPGTPPIDLSAVKSFKTFGLDYSYF